MCSLFPKARDWGRGGGKEYPKIKSILSIFVVVVFQICVYLKEGFERSQNHCYLVLRGLYVHPIVTLCNVNMFLAA